MSLSDDFDPNLSVFLPDGRSVSLARLHIDLCVELAERLRSERAERDRKRLTDSYAIKIAAAAAQGPQAINAVYAEQQRDAASARTEVSLLDIVAMADDPRGIVSIVRFAGEKAGSKPEDIQDVIRYVGPFVLRGVAMELLSFPVAEKQKNPLKPGAENPSTSGDGPPSSDPSTVVNPDASLSGDSST